MYQVICTLYSQDGKRCVEVRDFEGEETFILESELVERETFKARHGGRLVGPFDSPEHAETFITATAWFKGQ